MPVVIMCMVAHYLDFRSYQRLAGSCSAWRTACQVQAPSTVSYPFDGPLPWLPSFAKSVIEECTIDLCLGVDPTTEGDAMGFFLRRLGTASHVRKMNVNATHADWRIAQLVFTHVASCTAIHYTVLQQCHDCDTFEHFTCERCEQCRHCQDESGEINGTTHHNDIAWYVNSLPPHVSSIRFTSVKESTISGTRIIPLVLTLEESTRDVLNHIILDGVVALNRDSIELRDYANLHTLKMTIFHDGMYWSDVLVATSLQRIVLEIKDLCSKSGYVCRPTELCPNRMRDYAVLRAMLDSDCTASAPLRSCNLQHLAVLFSKQSSTSIAHAMYREQFNTLVKHSRCTRAMFIGCHAATIRSAMDVETIRLSSIETFAMLPTAVRALVTEADDLFVLLLTFEI